MSIAKAVISGTVYRNPEKRFTGNNIPVTSFTRGNNAESIEQAVSKGDRIVVEGRLQVSNIQGEDGTEKKVMEIDLSSFEILGSSNMQNASAKKTADEVVKFSETEMDDVLIGEEEIPF